MFWAKSNSVKDWVGHYNSALVKLFACTPTRVRAERRYAWIDAVPQSDVDVTAMIDQILPEAAKVSDVRCPTIVNAPCRACIYSGRRLARTALSIAVRMKDFENVYADISIRQ